MSTPTDPLNATRLEPIGPGLGDGALLSRTVGDYEIVQEIGRGGMGRVYKARQKSLGRVVALKTILSAELASAAAVQRFRKEAEAAAQLDHPGIVPVYEFGEHDGQHFIAMAYVEGRPLDSRLKQGPLDNTLAAFIVQHVAEAVAHAHQKGVVHRDLKPANVLIDRDGAVKVSDFGIARRLDAEADAEPPEDLALAVETVQRLTATGAVMGTPGYMAPEQIVAPRTAGPAADVWALGALLYDCLTGRPPFLGPNLVDTLALTITEQPIPPRVRNPNVDPGLEAICLRCLHKEPHLRFASAAEVAEDLARWQAGKPLRADPGGWLSKLKQPFKPHPALLPAAVGLVVAAMTNIQEGLFAAFVLAGTRLTPIRLGLREVVLTSLLGLVVAVFYAHYMSEHLTMTDHFAEFFGLGGVAPNQKPLKLDTTAEWFSQGLPFFVLLAMMVVPLGPLLATGLGSIGDDADRPSTARQWCWMCLALGGVGLLVVPAMAFPQAFPRPEQLWLERIGVAGLGAAWVYGGLRLKDRKVWLLGILMFVPIAALLFFVGLPTVRLFLGQLVEPADLNVLIRRDGWAVTFWLLSIPLGLSVGVWFAGLRRRLQKWGVGDPSIIARAFQLGTAVGAVVAPRLFWSLRPEVEAGFGCFGPSAASALAGWGLMKAFDLSLVGAVAFVYPAKLLLLTLPMAAGGLIGGGFAVLAFPQAKRRARP